MIKQLRTYELSDYQKVLESHNEKAACIQYLHHNYLIVITSRPKNGLFNIYDEHDFRYYLYDISLNKIVRNLSYFPRTYTEFFTFTFKEFVFFYDNCQVTQELNIFRLHEEQLKFVHTYDKPHVNIFFIKMPHKTNSICQLDVLEWHTIGTHFFKIQDSDCTLVHTSQLKNPFGEHIVKLKKIKGLQHRFQVQTLNQAEEFSHYIAYLKPTLKTFKHKILRRIHFNSSFLESNFYVYNKMGIYQFLFHICHKKVSFSQALSFEWDSAIILNYDYVSLKFQSRGNNPNAIFNLGRRVLLFNYESKELLLDKVLSTKTFYGNTIVMKKPMMGVIDSPSRKRKGGLQNLFGMLWREQANEEDTLQNQGNWDEANEIWYDIVTLCEQGDINQQRIPLQF